MEKLLYNELFKVVWGIARSYIDEDGLEKSINIAFTSLSIIDPFKSICNGRCDLSLTTERIKTLKANGSNNRHADAVVAPLFEGSAHFDPHDLVQVKYEMLHAVSRNEMTITDASKQFGFSRAIIII